MERFLRSLGSGAFKALAAIFILMSGLQEVQAQPAYYNTSTTDLAVDIPLNSDTNRVQWLYAPYAFRDSGSTGTLSPMGRVDTIYLKAADIVGGSYTFSDFTLSLSQNVGQDTSWSDSIWTSIQQVFYDTSYTIDADSGEWVAIPIQTIFDYDPSLSLVVDLSVSSDTGFSVESVTDTINVSKFGTHSDTMALGLGTGLARMGLALSNIPTNDAAVNAIVSPSRFCEGFERVFISIANNGTAQLDSVQVNWSVNDTLRTPVVVRSLIDTAGSSSGNLDTVLLGTEFFQFGVPGSMKIWTSQPNGVADFNTQDDTLMAVLHPAMNGTYTIGDTSRDYSSITAACADLNMYGVCGPVEFQIDSGTYNERLIIDQVQGVSAMNTIHFYGTDLSECTVHYDSDSARKDWQTVLINKTDHVEISNLSVEVLDSTYGVGIHVVGSSGSDIHDVNISMPVGQSSVNLFGVGASGYLEYVDSAGNPGDNNSFRDLKIEGGYCGLRYSGSNSTFKVEGLVVSGLSVADYAGYGVNISAVEDAVITENEVNSQLNSFVNGVRISTCNDFDFSRNRIFSVNEGLYVFYSNVLYADSNAHSVIANNMITNTGNTFSAFYNQRSRRTGIYHNSILSYGNSAAEFQDVDSTDVINNIFESQNQGFLLSITDSSTFYRDTYRLDHNVYYCPGSMNPIWFDTTIYTSIQNWFNGDTTLNKNSYDQDPGYIDSTDLHLSAQSPPTGIYAGIDQDFDGILRCLNAPTIGADEVIQGTFPDSNNATYICAGDTLHIDLHPPRGLNGYPYDSLWSMDSWRMQNANGGGGFPRDFIFVSPDSTHDGYFRMVPAGDEVGTDWELTCFLRDSTGNGCYESFGRYVKVETEAEALFMLNDTGICLGDTLEIRYQGAVSTTVGYLHDMGNGIQFTSEDVNYAYSAPGVYTLKHYVYNHACSDSSTTTIQYGGAQGARLDTMASTMYAINSGTMSDPDVLCSGGHIEYVYHHPDGFPDSTFGTNWEVLQISIYVLNGATYKLKRDVYYPTASDPFKVDIIDDGQLLTDTLLYTVRIRSKASINCEVRMDRYIVIGGGPDIQFSSDTACEENLVQFTDETVITGSGYMYDWNFGDGNTSTLKDPMNRYVDTGDYKVRLRVRDEYRCWGEANGEIKVHPLPNVSFDASGMCSSDPWNFTNQTTIAGSIDGYSWSFGDGYSTTQESPMHSYDRGGDYRVRLLARSDMGCVDSVDRVVNITETPDASFEADTACLGESTQFSSNSADSLSQSHFWRFGDASTAGGSDPLHRFARGGRVYNVFHRVIDPSGNCPDSVTQQVLVQDVPSVDFSISFDTSRQVTFTPSDTVGYSFKWYFGDGDSSTSKVPTHTYAQSPQEYLVRMQVSSNQECRAERSAWVDFRSAGIDAELVMTAKVRPNPVLRNGFLRIELTNAPDAQLELRDMYGRQLGVQFTRESGSDEFTLRPSQFDLSSGLYILTIKTNGNVISERVRIID